VFVIETDDTCRGGSMLESIRCLALHSRPRRVPVPHEQLRTNSHEQAGRTIYKLAQADVKNTPLSKALCEKNEMPKLPSRIIGF
jgi:hypothetical protein